MIWKRRAKKEDKSSRRLSLLEECFTAGRCEAAGYLAKLANEPATVPHQWTGAKPSTRVQLQLATQAIPSISATTPTPPTPATPPTPPTPATQGTPLSLPTQDTPPSPLLQVLHFKLHLLQVLQAARVSLWVKNCAPVDRGSKAFHQGST